MQYSQILPILLGLAFVEALWPLTKELYTPLDETTDSLRLVDIRPGSGRDDIECQLWTTTFAANPTYRALSYTWGDSMKSRLIWIDGKQVSVGDNLWSALQHLRDPRYPKTLWIDALSINQENVKEKNQQIPLMPFIYRRAKEVLVWLGPQEPPKELFLKKDSLSSLSNPAAKTVDHSFWRSIEYWIYQMMYQEYWKRAWIIQEIGVASKIQVCFGRKSLPWDQFIWIIKGYEIHVAREPPLANILALHKVRQSKYGDGETYSLSSLLSTFRNAFSGLPYDKIYAFLGMANDYLDGSIPIDYNKTLFELYQDVLRFLNKFPIESMEKRIEIVYLSALVRRLLTRKSGKMIKNVNDAPSSDSWMKWCETRADCTDGSDLFVISLNADRLMNIGLWIKWLFKPKEYTTFWLPSGHENIEFWGTLQDDCGTIGFNVRGIVGGQIERLGPSYLEITSSSQYTKLWKAALIEHFADLQVLKRRRGQTERLLDMLAESAYSSRIWNIIPLRESKELYRSDEVHSPLIFLGSNDMTGLVPPDVRVGDIIVQFWNSSASAVVREESRGKYELIGRAGVIKDGESDDWDIPLDQGLFGAHSSVAVELEMDIMTLTKLSLDTVDLPSDAETDSSKGRHIEL